MFDNQRCIDKLSLKQLQAESLEWLEKEQELRSTAVDSRMRSKQRRRTAQEVLERSQQLKHSDSQINIFDLLYLEPQQSFLIAEQLQSDFDQRLEIIKETQSDVAERLDKMQQLHSKVEQALQNVGRLIANRQSDVSDGDTSVAPAKEAIWKAAIEDVYRLIHQVNTGNWLEDERETASDSL